MLATAAIALSFSAAALAVPPVPEGPDFTAERFKSHVTFLADDLLEGRDTGSRGYEIAANYVATQFEGLGLKAAGPQGSWYQQVPFMRFALGDTPGTVRVGGQSFTHGQQILLSPRPQQGALSVEAPVVFVGYGLSAPQIGVDDYKGLNVKGKIVVALGGFPKGMASDIGAHLNSEKRRVASDKGAIGMITLRTRAEAERRPWARAVEGAGEPVMSWTDASGGAYQPAPNLQFRATFDTPAAEALFAGASRSLAQVLDEAAREGGKPRGFALKQKVAVEQGQGPSSRVSSPNVVAMLPGSDPALAGEYVLLMAHLDHVGVKPEGEGDTIYNGAMDNATGIATMLEVARAMATGPNRPKRSILFAAVTGEEKGLQGAQYLARNPLPGTNVVGVVNLDMPVLLYDFTDVIAFGAEHSTMGPAVAAAGARMGVALTPDPLPQEGLFTRSDHYRFVQEGIPAVFLMTGFAGEGREKFEGFLATNYHKVSDDLKQPINWQAGAKFARINYEIATEIANAPQAPRWYSDSFFGKTLAPKEEKATKTGK
ncbi:MAG TPA: M28 family metallopeptidase [Allosphingosinicella sp.]|jgi:hypothetical protein